MATTVAVEIVPDKVISFRIVPGTLEQFHGARVEGGPLIKCVKGSLTLMSPGRTHETSDRKLALLIVAIGAALRIPVSPLGSTYNGMPGDTGYEPDESYYVQSHGTAAPDQVPDLAIEVVVSNPETKALAAGAQLGIAELWVWDIPDRRLTFPFLSPTDVLGRVGAAVDAATFDAGAFSKRNRAWASRVLLPRLRAAGNNA